MLHVGPQNPFEMPTTQHKDMVQALGPDGLDPPLGVGVRLRRAVPAALLQSAASGHAGAVQEPPDRNLRRPNANGPRAGTGAPIRSAFDAKEKAKVRDGGETGTWAGRGEQTSSRSSPSAGRATNQMPSSSSGH